MSKVIRVYLLLFFLFGSLAICSANDLLRAPESLSTLASGSMISGSTLYFVDGDKADNSGDGLSWSTAFRDIQSALDLASASDQIWIKAGIYFPTDYYDGCTNCTSPRQYTFLLKDSVEIYGGFAGTETNLDERDWMANETIISGDTQQNDVVTGAGADLVISGNEENICNLIISARDSKSTVLDGLIIEGARADSSFSYTIETFGFFGTLGGNITVRGGSPTVRNCTSRNSYVMSNSNTFRDNCFSEITNCRIVNNYSEGVSGIGTAGDSDLLIDRTIFDGNHSVVNGGCMQANGGCNPVFTNCIFRQNYCGGLGVIIYQRITGTSEFINCTFIENEGGVDLFQEQGSSIILVKNSIIYDNPEDAGSEADFTNCLFSDPMFVDESDYDGPDDLLGTDDDGCNLQIGSPAIDFGDKSLIPDHIKHDVRYQARIKSDTVDAGAFEYGPDVAFRVGAQEYFTLSNAILEAVETGNDIFELRDYIELGEVNLPEGVTINVLSGLQLSIAPLTMSVSPGGNTNHTLEIEKQKWLHENGPNTKFRNGSATPTIEAVED